MLNNASEQPGAALELTSDTPVFDVNGKKLGAIAEPAIQGDYFVVEKGIVFTRQLLVPLTAIHARDANGVYLNLSEDDLLAQQGNLPPTGGSAVEAAGPPVLPQVRADSGLNTPIAPGALGNSLPETEPPLGQR